VEAVAPALIDELMPRFDEVERHERLVRAAPAAVWAALWRVDLLSSALVRWLVMLRGAPSALRHPHRPARRRTVTLRQVLERSGFVLLGERPERVVALGVVGRFWTPRGERLTVDAPSSWRSIDRAMPRRGGTFDSHRRATPRGCRRRRASSVWMRTADGDSGATGG
jgi:hypothetical protein